MHDRRLRKLLAILVPGVATPEVRATRMLLQTLIALQVGYFILVSAMMICRTYCDLWMINNGTSIER